MTSIGDWAFCDCTTLTSVTLPDSVTSIGMDAFEDCTGLTSITIPDSVTSIGMEAFEDCTGLTSVTIGSGVTRIGSRAFHETGYYNDDANWEDGVLYIGKYLIEANDTLEGAYAIREGTKLIADNAFYGCEKLTSVTIPDSVTSIGDEAFEGCGGLTSIMIGDGVTSIDSSAFNGTGYFSDSSNWTYDVLYIGTYLIATRDTISGACAIKEGTKLIANCAFKNRAGLTSVTIPDSVTGIGEAAFEDCTGLTSVTIPDSVKIGEAAFYGCSGLTSVTIPDSVTIGDWAFGHCSGLTSVTIPDSLTSIGNYTFMYCIGLTNVIIGSGVLSIGEGAFSNCTGLTNITIPDSVRSIGDWAFCDCSGLTSVTIPDSLTSIGNHTFMYCTALTSITIPNSVTSIGEMAFYRCTVLTSVTIPDSVTSIGNYAFDGCDELKSVTIPASVTTIGEEAFGYYWNSETHERAKVDGFTIYGYQGSAAQTYAEENGFTFITLETVPCQHEHAHPEHKDATCTEPGYDRMICDDCGEVISETILPALGHAWDNGIVTVKPTETTDGVKTFTCSRCGATRAEVIPAAGGKTNPFADAKEGDFYYDAVLWAVNANPQVTSGTSATTFSPNDTCTRAQVVTFLWRAKGCPEPKSNDNPFKDVKVGEYYYKAVLWAVENEITAGTSATTFSPNTGCTRAQVVTFLWRTEGQPKPTSSANPFKDVTGGYYYDAVLWAVEKNITSGTSATTFSPDNTCTRGQIVTFLYRALD